MTFNSHTDPQWLSQRTSLCSVIQPLLSLLTLGELTFSQSQAVRYHVTECEHCRAALTEYQEVDEALKRYFTCEPRADLPAATYVPTSFEDFLSAAESAVSAPRLPVGMSLHHEETQPKQVTTGATSYDDARTQPALADASPHSPAPYALKTPYGPPHASPGAPVGVAGRAQPYQPVVNLRMAAGKRNVRSVYLGGNITRNDWRHMLVSNLGPVGVAPAYPDPSSSLWPSLPAAVINRFDYVGPYSISGHLGEDVEWNDKNADPGTEWVISAPHRAVRSTASVSRDVSAFHSEDGQSQEVWWPLVRSARAVQRLVMQALERTDLYFAWLDTPLCAATLTEVGWAQSKGKIVWVAGPKPFDELWLAYTMADLYSFHYSSPVDAFQNMLQATASGEF
jgi:hypothetical protein